MRALVVLQAIADAMVSVAVIAFCGWFIYGSFVVFSDWVGETRSKRSKVA